MNFSSFTQLFLQLLVKIRTSVSFVFNTFTFVVVKVAGQMQMCVTFLAFNDFLYAYVICVLILFTYSCSHKYVHCPSGAADIRGSFKF